MVPPRPRSLGSDPTMRLSHSAWAAAAFVAASVGFLVGTGRHACPGDDCGVTIPALGEESDGPRLLPAETIDLSCVEPVLPFDLFAHTSEPPLAGPLPVPDVIRPVVFEVPEFDGPALPVIIPEFKDDPAPGPLPKGIE